MNLSAFPWSRLFRLSLATAALAASAQASAELVLYEDDDYSGRPYRAYAPVNNLASVNFNDKASSVVVRSGAWQLCGDADFRGQCITLAAGSYPSLREMGLNDRVSSVRPAGFGGGGGGGGGNNGGGWGGGGWGGGNAAVELFEHADYDGRSIASTGSPNLARQGFNDKVSSIVIRSGRWEFCSDADYRGACVTLGPGSYGKLGPMNMNDVISSLRPSSGPPSWGGGRPNPGGWAGDDGDAPDVVLAGNRSGRVTFNNGCVVFYNRDGQRFQNLPACHGRQVQRADEAMARHRQDQGMSRPDDEHPWANAPGYGNNDPTPPEIIMGGNREGEVIFRNNCVVYYNAQGRRWRQQPSCSGNQVRRADEAMAAHRREQGY